MKKILITSMLLMVFSLKAFASSTTEAKIVQIEMAKSYGEYVFIKLDKRVIKERCIRNGYWNYTLPLATELDKVMYTALISAMISGKKVSISGSDTCDEFAAIESAKSIRVYGD